MAYNEAWTHEDWLISRLESWHKQVYADDHLCLHGPDWIRHWAQDSLRAAEMIKRLRDEVTAMRERLDDIAAEDIPGEDA